VSSIPVDGVLMQSMFSTEGSSSSRGLGAEAAYLQYFAIIRAKCGRMLRDPEEAEDVAQETFLRLLRAPVLGQHVAVVTAWIYRTSTHLALDRLRRTARAKRNVDVATRLVAPTLATAPDRALELRQLLARLVQEVPEAELTAVLLTRLDGLEQAEVAEVLGISDRTVRRHLDRFVRRLAVLHAEDRV
jgi:RNA polymerase sigma-70 factor, ECF subfamily